MKLYLKALVLAAGIFAAVNSSVDAAENKSLTLVELHTSQGCSSCPLADAFLGELAKRDDVMALSVHVDYWDYIGWKDCFANPENTKRQRRYAQYLGLRYVYTPQMVIDGADHVTGSDRTKTLKNIKAAAKTKGLAVRVRRDGDGFRISVPAGAKEEAAVWMALFDNRHDTEIKCGENSGRTLGYCNVVREMIRIGTWSGQTLTITTKGADMPADGRDGCAVIVQSIKTGRILGKHCE